MHVRRIQVVIAALAVIGSTMVALPAARAMPPDPDLTVTSVTLGRASVAVSGLNMVPVPVTLKASYPPSSPPDAHKVLSVVLRRSGGVGPLNLIVAGDLVRTAGTAQNGTWTGKLNVPSTANGTFKVSGVVEFDSYTGDDGSKPGPTPFAGPSIAIRGVHIPKIGVSVVPRVVPFNAAYQVRAAIYDSATGKAYGTRILLQVVRGNLCAEYDAGSKYTNTAGLLVTNFAGAGGDINHCVRVRGRYVDTLAFHFYPLRPGIVSAAPVKTSAPVGEVVLVNGSVKGGYFPTPRPVTLQRLYGAVWRGVSASSVRQSGRITLTAQPPSVGSFTYRVYLPAFAYYQAGASKSFVIRGT
ncbi:hypothetical protein [Kribbella sp. NPDC051718]|uniref:hypothetical protein n=1 Tax=Kribbella sp. NPDC051718 TaxID=3155168 RepID=UPI0034451958